MNTQTLFSGWVVYQDVETPNKGLQAEHFETVTFFAERAISDLVKAEDHTEFGATLRLKSVRLWLLEHAIRNNTRFVELPYAVCFKGNYWRIDQTENFFDRQATYNSLATRNRESYGYAHENRVLTEWVDIKALLDLRTEQKQQQEQKLKENADKGSTNLNVSAERQLTIPTTWEYFTSISTDNYIVLTHTSSGYTTYQAYWNGNGWELNYGHYFQGNKRAAITDYFDRLNLHIN